MTDRDKQFEANFSSNSDEHLQKSLKAAKELALNLKHSLLTPEHLLAVLMDNPDAATAIEACKKDPADIKATLMDYLTEGCMDLVSDDPDLEVSWSDKSIGVCHRANVYRTTAMAAPHVTGASILIGFIDMLDTFAGDVLAKNGISRFNLVNWISHKEQKGERPASREAVLANAGAEGKSRHSGQETALQQFAKNLNERAKEGRIGALIGRDSEIEQAVNILSCRRKSNVLFVGEAGVGKTSIAEGLASRIVSGDVPAGLKDCVVHALDMPSVVAGARYRGDFEERMKAIVKEATEDPNVILFIDEIHSIVGAGASQGGMDASNIMKPELANGELRCMGATTRKEYRKYFEKDAAMARRFQKVEVAEPSRDEAVGILNGASAKFEEHHAVTYTAEALEAAVDLSIRYLASRRLPDKALDIIDLAGAVHSSVAKSKDGPLPEVTVEDVCIAVSKLAKVPVSSNTLDQREAVRRLATELPMVIFNQQRAIDALVETVEVAGAGLNEPDKPLASFIFAGPAGVGKTELTTQLAKILNIELLRFDMSEYMEKHAVSRLIGAPPGYVGYDEGGLLTEGVDANPHCVLLLDEVEKAHPDIHNALLQVLDYGKLTDSNGRKIDFRNTIIVLTTNAGSELVAKTAMGFGTKENDGDAVQDALKAAFSAPFRSRVNSIIQFNPITEAVVELVVDKEIFKIEKLLSKNRLTLSLTSDARTWIARKGFDKELGARPMANVVRSHVRVPLARQILAGAMEEGGVQISVKEDGSGLSFAFTPVRAALPVPAE